MTQNFENTKVGDTVLIRRHRYPDALEQVQAVTRTTITAGNQTFNKRDGRRRGSGTDWTFTTIYIPDKEDLDRVRKEIAKRNLIYKLTSIDLKSMRLEDLQKIWETTEGMHYELKDH